MTLVAPYISKRFTHPAELWYTQPLQLCQMLSAAGAGDEVIDAVLPVYLRCFGPEFLSLSWLSITPEGTSLADPWCHSVARAAEQLIASTSVVAVQQAVRVTHSLHESCFEELLAAQPHGDGPGHFELRFVRIPNEEAVHLFPRLHSEIPHLDASMLPETAKFGLPRHGDDSGMVTEVRDDWLCSSGEVEINDLADCVCTVLCVRVFPGRRVTASGSSLAACRVLLTNGHSADSIHCIDAAPGSLGGKSATLMLKSPRQVLAVAVLQLRVQPRRGAERPRAGGANDAPWKSYDEIVAPILEHHHPAREIARARWNEPSTLLDAGWAAFRQGDLRGASAAWMKVAASSPPDSITALDALALEAEVVQRDVMTARALLQRAIEIDAWHAPILLRLAHIEEAIGNDHAAMTLYSAGLQLEHGCDTAGYRRRIAELRKRLRLTHP